MEAAASAGTWIQLVKSWLGRLIIAIGLVLAGLGIGATTEANATNLTYDASAVARNDVGESADSDALGVQVSSVWESSASPTPTGRGTSTTPLPRKNATKTVDLTSPGARTHILDGEVRPNGTYSGGHRAGTGYPGKSEFPAGWSDDQIIHNISDVATDPASLVVPKGGADFVSGTRGGVDIEVIIRNGQIKTGYPTNLPRNP